ncbi:MFS transporter [Actinomycetota bacterium]|nr:MFS transporter [Actinomycetota bacterium]
MSTSSQAPTSAKSKQAFYGWRMVIMLGLIFFVTGAIVFNTATIANSYMKLDESMDISATVLGLGYSIYILLQGITAPFIGRFGEKKGNFKICFIAGTALCAVCAAVLALFLNNAVIYLLFFGLLMSIGTGLGGPVPIDATVAYWFKRKRGLTMGIVLGVCCSGAILGPPIINGIYSITGSWQSLWWLLTGLSLVVFIISLFLYTRPSDYGQFPDGIDENSEAGLKIQESKVYKRKESLSFKEGIKSRNTWLIMMGGGIGQFVYTFTVSFGMLHFMNLGFAATAVTAALAARGVGSTLGSFLPGFIADRLEPIKIMGIGIAITGVLYFLGATTNNEFIMFAFFAFTGWSIGSFKVLSPTALANWVGVDNFPRIYGYTLLVLAIVVSTIPILAGMLFDVVGNYALAAQIIGGFCFAGAIACFVVRYPKKKTLEDSN